MKNSFKFETKAIISLLIILIFIVVIGVITYNRFTSIVNSIRDNSRPDVRLLSTKSLQTHLKQLENNAKTFSLTQDSLYLNQFNETKIKIDDDFKELHEIKFENRFLDINQLDSLITEKIIILQALLNSQDQFRVQAAISKIETVTYQTAKKSAATKEEVVEEKAERKFFDIFRRKKDSEEKNSENTTETKPEQQELQTLTTQINIIKSEELNIEEQLKQTELELITEDNQVTMQINALLDNFEEKELVSIDKTINEIKVKASKTNVQIAIVCIVISILILFLSYLIMNYVTKNNKYGKALKESKREAEKLAKAKQQFIANMSHEIRTPMNAIVGFAEQLDSGPLKKEQKEQLSTIRSSADHLMHLINEILDFSKLEHQKLYLEQIPMNPCHIVKDVKKYFDKAITDKQIELNISVDENCPKSVIGDPFRLRQILLNLISNSIKFTDKGEINVSVEAILKDSENVVLQYVVQDTGIGMDKSFLLKIFDEFEQAELSTSRNYGGTGLGLSITKRLIELHKGTIYIDSDLGEGTKVTFEIPYTIPTGTPESKEPQHAEVVTSIGHLKFLIVDDEEYNRNLLATILKKHNANFDLAEDGKEAIELASKNNYDVIFMDARMPKMNGIEATKEIRNTNTTNVKIIAITAAIEVADKQNYQNVGMNGIVVKPFKEDQLLLEIQRVTNNEDFIINPETESDHLITEDHINFSNLKELSNGDQIFYIDMLQTFVQSTESGLQKIHEAFDKGELLSIADQAHKISAPCKHLKAEKLYQQLKKLESSTRMGEKNSKTKLLIHSIQEEFNFIRPIIDHELEQIIT